MFFLLRPVQYGSDPSRDRIETENVSHLPQANTDVGSAALLIRRFYSLVCFSTRLYVVEKKWGKKLNPAH